MKFIVDGQEGAPVRLTLEEASNGSVRLVANGIGILRVTEDGHILPFIQLIEDREALEKLGFQFDGNRVVVRDGE